MPISPELDQVQQAILAIHRDRFGESPSPMKLQKLCYYAQGYSLAEGEELFTDDFEAWQHGPVVPDLYRKYRDVQWRPIEAEATVPELDPAKLECIEGVVEAYGRYDGAALSTMTHREQPWQAARGNLPESANSEAPILKPSLEAFFAAKLRSK